MLKEFKEFIMRGNVIDMAVGIIQNQETVRPRILGIPDMEY